MMYDDDGDSKEVLYWHTVYAHKMLGVMLAPNDNNTSQTNIMHQILIKFGKRVRIGFISGRNIFHAL